MSGEKHVVILVYSTSHALQAEHVLAEAGIDCKLIPVPRQLSSDCGVCVRIALTDRDPAIQALEVSRVEIESIHEV